MKTFSEARCVDSGTASYQMGMLPLKYVYVFIHVTVELSSLLTKLVLAAESAAAWLGS